MKKLIYLLLLPCLLQAEPFVTAQFWGRLGNQLFQIAAAVSLALDHDAKASFPKSLTATHDDIPSNYAHIYFRVNVDEIDAVEFTYEEPTHNYSPIPYHPNMNIVGFFQSEKYFKHHKQEIIDLFSPTEETWAHLEEQYGDLIHNPNTVAVHVRCYFLERANLKHFFPFYTKKYYTKVMSQFPKETIFVFFSDRIDWCKDAFSDTPFKILFMEGNTSYHDFYLLSLFRRMVLSNSSFAWWAAYLNKNPDKVIIAPPKWMYPKKGDDSDIIPEGWIRIKSFKEIQSKI